MFAITKTPIDTIDIKSDTTAAYGQLALSSYVRIAIEITRVPSVARNDAIGNSRKIIKNRSAALEARPGRISGTVTLLK
jgi:hypothetical protein